MTQETVPIVTVVPGSQIKSSECGMPSKPIPQFFGEATWNGLATALSSFSQHMSKALDGADSADGACFQVDHAEVSAVITADGKIGLLGSSFGGGVQGGVKLVWRRKATGTQKN